MTDKFLNAGDAGNISNGTISIFGSKIGAKNLDPSRAIKTDSQGRLQTTDLDIGDVNNLQSTLDAILSNPYTPPVGGQFVVNGEIKCTDLETNDFFSLNDEISKTEYMSRTFGLTTIASNILTDDVACSSILNQISSTRIDMTSSTDINFQATNVTINSNDILTNPLTAVLDCDSNNIVNMGQFNIDMTSFVINTEGQLSTLQTDTGTLQTDVNNLETKTQLLTSSSTVSTFSKSLAVREFLTVAKVNPTLDSGNCSALFILDGGSGLFSIQKVNGSNIDELFRINTVAKIDMLVPLDMNNEAINNVTTINGITPVGGLYSGLSDGALISGSLIGSLLPATGTPSNGLSVPANGFKVGDSFHLVCAGDIPVGDKDDIITITLNQDGSQLAQLSVDMEDSTNTFFELEADFQVRSIGVSGQIVTNFDFTFNKQLLKDFKGSRKVQLSTIDTTSASTLTLTAQFGGVYNSTIQTRLFYLRKQF